MGEEERRKLTQILFDLYGKKLPTVFWDQLSEFCDSYPNGRLIEIWNKVRLEDHKDHKIYGVPKIENFEWAAKKLGIRPKVKSSYSANECRKCKMVFSIESRGCPNCKEITDVRVIVSSFPIQYVELQELCYKCPWDLSPFASVGPKCGAYGMGNTIPDCDKCGCKDCCREAHELVLGNEARWDKGSYHPELLESDASPGEGDKE